MRVLILLHRYLAVAVGLLMTLWCLSGFVMMYQSFPELSQEQQLRGLQPLRLDNCCDIGSYGPHDDTPLSALRIEMLLGEPVLRIGGRDATVIRLSDGQALNPLSQEQVLTVAQQFGQGNNIAGTPTSRGVIDIDQWTLQSARRNAPAWHIAFDDPAATHIYINGSTGEVFQHTNRRERVLSWFGAIPHWLYPTVLRQNGPLWTQIVIWTSILGTVLAATGMYVGIRRMLWQRQKKQFASRNPGLRAYTPYQGLWKWHHVSGLTLGILVLTWVFSGLLTMNPWGTLNDTTAQQLRSTLNQPARWADLKQLLRTLNEPANATQLPADTRQLVSAPFNRELFMLAVPSAGSSIRLNRDVQQQAVTDADIDVLLDALGQPVARRELMYHEDNYYYGHKRRVPLPVVRVMLDDPQASRIYIDPQTGATRTISSTGRWSRWLRTGLHDLDFPVLRLRPLWDIVVIVLLAGVTLVCATGTWMAFRRVRRDWRSWHYSRRRQRRLQSSH